MVVQISPTGRGSFRFVVGILRNQYFDWLVAKLCRDFPNIMLASNNVACSQISLVSAVVYIFFFAVQRPCK